MKNAWQDIRYAVRLAAKNPSFTMVAVLSLGIGIGMSTVLFSIIYGVLLRPLPYIHPDRSLPRWSRLKRSYRIGSSTAQHGAGVDGFL